MGRDNIKFRLSDGSYDAVKRIYESLSAQEKNYVTPGRTIYKDIPSALAARTVAYADDDPAGFVDIYGPYAKSKHKHGAGYFTMETAVKDDYRGNGLSPAMAVDAIKKVVGKIRENRQHALKHGFKLPIPNEPDVFLWNFLRGNKPSENAALRAGFVKRKNQSYMMPMSQAEKLAAEKRAAQTLVNAPIAHTGFDRWTDLAGTKLKTVGKRLLASIPGGTFIPSVRRQEEADYQKRFNDWFGSLPPEAQKRFYDVAFKPGIWAPGQRERIYDSEFSTMPGGIRDRIAQYVTSFGVGRIKAYRPVLSGIQSMPMLRYTKSSPSGATVKSLRNAGIKPNTELSEITDAIAGDIRNIEDGLVYTSTIERHLPATVFDNNKIIKNLDVLQEIDPSLKKRVVKALGKAEPIKQNSVYIHSKEMPFDAESIRKVTMEDFRKDIMDRIHRSLSYIRQNRKISSRFPVKIEGGSVSKESLKGIHRWLISEAEKGHFGRDSKAIDLARRTKIDIRGAGNGSWGRAHWDGVKYQDAPTIESEFVKGTRGREPYINTDAIRHEFGHILDLHGTQKGKTYSSNFVFGQNYNNARDTIASEIRANRNGGLPNITPWTDTYFATSGDSDLMKRVMKKYPPKKIPLPK